LREKTTAHVKQAGLTLLELLVIVLVIILIASYLVPKFFSPVEETNDKVAFVQMRSIAEALDRFHKDEQRYPTSEEGLAILVDRLANEDTAWRGPYLPKPVLNDPWGNPYVYQAPGREKGYDLLSWGADGKPDGSGENADITY
jgi:general secretion pathway protein G